MRTFIAMVALAISPSAWAACSPSEITIKSLKARFVNECRGSPCLSLKGVAVLTNGCAEAVGVQLKITGYDKTGAPVASHDLWPASIANIRPGDYTFSLDSWLAYDPAIKFFELRPISVRKWR